MILWSDASFFARVSCNSLLNSNASLSNSSTCRAELALFPFRDVNDRLLFSDLQYIKKIMSSLKCDKFKNNIKEH